MAQWVLANQSPIHGWSGIGTAIPLSSQSIPARVCLLLKSASGHFFPSPFYFFKSSRYSRSDNPRIYALVAPFCNQLIAGSLTK